MISTRERLIFVLIAVVGAFIITRTLAPVPTITDSMYHFNAANQLVSGRGLTDEYLWHYIGAPDHLPAPSHLYWMPLTSLSAALGMALFNAPGSYAAAQVPFALMLAGIIYIAFWLGEKLGGTRRHAWLAGILTLLGGYFARFWGQTDTFAPYGLVGGLCLLFMGLAVQRCDRRGIIYWLLAGAMAGLGHLARADGLLLLLVSWAVILWPFYRSPELRRSATPVGYRLVSCAAVTAAYLLVMVPWFARNLEAVGSPLPVGGTQGIWFSTYDDLFNYPPDSSPQTFFADGVGLLIETRWMALTGSLGTLVAVEGVIVLFPLMLVALWKRRSLPFLRGFWLYALGLHLAMTLIFPFPGVRGGLFHSSAALLPFWMALGVAGLDDVIDWVAERRRRWRPETAKRVFSAALVLLVLGLTMMTALPRRAAGNMPRLYPLLTEALPPDARVMINDPARLFYYTGLGGVVIPNEAPEVIADIARKYEIDYLVVEAATVGGQPVWAVSSLMLPVVSDPPAFLSEIKIDVPDVKLYAIEGL